MVRIKTPSGLDAEVLFPNCWGPERASAGLRYIGAKSRRRLAEVFTNSQIIFDLNDIVDDMNEYKFGYVDDLRLSYAKDLSPSFGHLLPIAYITDNLPNCMWHSDKIRIQMGEEADRIFDPSAVTFLYPDRLDESAGPKETGFAHPACVSQAYAAAEPGLRVGPTVEELRDFAEEAAAPLRPESGLDFHGALQRVFALLRGSYEQMDAILADTGDVAMHWLPHKAHRLMLFSNTIVHSNDLVRRDRVTARQQQVFRRMLPGGRMLGFNTGLLTG